MKKFALLFVLLSLLYSCSSDSDTVSEPQLTTEGYLLKKSFQTTSSGVTTFEYFYEGNKIIKMEASNGQRYEVTYTNDLITKKEIYINDILNHREIYQYDAQQRITQRKDFFFNPNSAARSEFTYNADQTVTLKRYLGDFTTQNTLQYDRKAFLLPNGEIDKLETYLTINGNAVTRTYQVNYDSYNNTSNPIIGLNKIKYWDIGSFAGGLHNVISQVDTTTENSNVFTLNFSFTYNSYGYPVTSSFIGGDTEMFYQQP